MKNKIKNTTWLTLIEIIVVITLIGLLSLGATSVDFSRLSVRQEHEIFTNDIITKFDTVRNFAFQGRGIWVNLDTPDQWNLEITTAWNWALTTTYNGIISWTYSPTTITVGPGYSITWLECITLNNTIPPQSITTATISFTNSDISISGCPNVAQKILRFNTSHSTYSSIIEVNAISGIIQTR